ncbi:hypothetical protein MRB53_021162 [Persea americana]|uniref:Uncharacterized protein n=1 Tax=Persea americana TaxID=3435 RepID=A0ACC2L352_PERAE|nr:hypothetical protein MRB53_021162 [Persea americana]
MHSGGSDSFVDDKQGYTRDKNLRTRTALFSGSGFHGESSGDEKLWRWFPTENKPNKALFLSVSSYVRRLPTKSPSPIWRSVPTISTLTAPEPKPPPSVVFFHYGSDARAGSGRRRFRRLTVLVLRFVWPTNYLLRSTLSNPIQRISSDHATML